MPSSLTPYNFTIPDQSPLFQYLPFRDGPISTSWNVTYADSPDSTWIPDTFVGAGPSSHRTTAVGASVQLDWTGTAIYLYGEAPVAGYTILLDGAQMPGVTSAAGLLFSKSDLQYGSHSIVLQVVQGPLSISNATITVGMGETGTTVQNHTMETTEVPLTTDGFVLYGSWQYAYPYGNTVYPRIGTADQGATVSFPLTSATAFYIIGAVNFNHGLYTVTVTSSLDSDSLVTSQYNASSRWIGLDMIKYLATGLNRSNTYQVAVTDNSPGQFFDINQVVVLDTPPSESSSSSGSNSHAPRTAAIAGIAVGSMLVLLASVAILFYLRRRRQRRESQLNSLLPIENDLLQDVALRPFPWTEFPANGMSEPASTPPIAINQYNRNPATRKTDARPMTESSPPSYDHIQWTESH